MHEVRADAGRFGYERMVPSVLLPPEDPSGSRPRTARDWLVDLGAVAAAAALGVASFAVLAENAPNPLPSSLLAIDLVLGGCASLALLARRRRPIAVGLLTVAACTVSVAAGFAATFALFTAAVHRRFARVLPVLVGHVVAANAFRALRPGAASWLVVNGVTVAGAAIVVGFGMFVRARRQLVWTLHERTRRAEAEQELLAERARAAERARIAREMHDVLGHRISLLTLHAGGLEVRPDLPPTEVAAVAGLLRETARQALDDLRAVIGVLRADGTVDAPTAPQPTLADLDRLVAESRRAGATVTLSTEVDRIGTAPEAAGRIAYRVVQEALTNVAKHAPGAATIVDVSGGPDEGLAVRVANAVPANVGADGGESRPLGGGFGLIGLRERVELAGGTLGHGLDARGQFVVEARLRWS